MGQLARERLMKGLDSGPFVKIIVWYEPNGEQALVQLCDLRLELLRPELRPLSEESCARNEETVEKHDADDRGLE
jgi:hypothetical protein